VYIQIKILELSDTVSIDLRLHIYIR